MERKMYNLMLSPSERSWLDRKGKSASKQWHEDREVLDGLNRFCKGLAGRIVNEQDIQAGAKAIKETKRIPTWAFDGLPVLISRKLLDIGQPEAATKVDKMNPGEAYGFWLLCEDCILHR